MSGRHHLLLNLYSCWLIPGYTLLFAGSMEWFQTNFSVLAVTGADHYRGFLLWGILAGGYFGVMLTHMAFAQPQPWRRRSILLITLLACGALAYSLAIPYLPDYFPRYAQLHVLLALLACVLLMAAVLLVVLPLPDARGRGKLLRGWWGVVVGCGVLFAMVGMVSSALEVFFTISATLLVRKLWLDMKR